MKHKLIKLISVIVIAAFLCHELALANPTNPHPRGEDGYNLRPVAFREKLIQGDERREIMFLRLGEDLYYLTRYFMEEIVGVPFTDFELEDLRQEALVASYEALAEYPKEKTKTLLYIFIYDRIKHHILGNFARAGGIRPSNLAHIFENINLILTNPGPGFEGELIVPRERVLQHLKEKISFFDEIVRKFRCNYVVSYDSRKKPRRFVKGKIIAPKYPDEAETKIADIIDKARPRISKVLASLQSLQDRDVIEFRYRVGVAHPYTLDELRPFFKVKNRERVRQIEERALRRLQHLSRANELVDFYLDLRDEREEMERREKEDVIGLRLSEYAVLLGEELLDFPPEPLRLGEEERVRPLTHREEDRLLAWFRDRIGKRQIRLIPYLLQGLSDEEIAQHSDIPRIVINKRQNVIEKLRRWFTLGVFREFGTPEQVKDHIVRLLSEMHLERTIRRRGLGRRAVLSAILRPRAAVEKGAGPNLGVFNADLPVLATSEGRDLARVLRSILDELRFDFANRELRGSEAKGDYEAYPLPLPISAIGINEMRDILVRSVAVSSNDLDKLLFRRMRFAFEFFVFGTPLNENQLDLLFGEAKIHKERFFKSGLFARTADGRIRMNGLSLVSRELKNGEIMYLLVDTPPYFESCMAPERVYIGSDSYDLMERVYNAPAVTGYCVDMGSGSGIQLIALLLRCQGVEKTIGVEIDTRARHVSIFNAALNGVEDRFLVVDDEMALRQALGGRHISFAMSNPPFVALPELVDIDQTDEAALSGVVNVVRAIDGHPQISLKELYAKAGWAGEDGLYVTKKFLSTLFPLRAPKGPIIIFSQFAGNGKEPTKIKEYMQGIGGFDVVFEPLKPKIVFTRRGAARSLGVHRSQELAMMAVGNILQQHPEFKSRAQILLPVFKKIVPRVEAVYQRQGITHFQDGYLIMVKQDTGISVSPSPVPVPEEYNAILSAILRPRPSLEKAADIIKFEKLTKENVAIYAPKLALIDASRGFGEEEGYWDEARFKEDRRASTGTELIGKWEFSEVAVVNGEPVAYLIGIRPVEDFFKDFSIPLEELRKNSLHLLRIAVEPDYRGLKIGAQLVRNLALNAKRDGKRYIYVDVLTAREEAVNFYKKCGFELVRDELYKGYVSLKMRVSVDVLLITTDPGIALKAGDTLQIQNMLILERQI